MFFFSFVFVFFRGERESDTFFITLSFLKEALLLLSLSLSLVFFFFLNETDFGEKDFEKRSSKGLFVLRVVGRERARGTFIIARVHY